MPAAAADTKRRIEAALRALGAPGPLRAATLEFWRTLGYGSDRTLVLHSKADFRHTFDRENKLNETTALWPDWQEVEFLFQLTDDDLNAAQAAAAPRSLFESAATVDNTAIFSYVFLAVRLRTPSERRGDRRGKPYTRGELAGITRAVNGLLPMPALILFAHGGALTLAVINRRLHKTDAGRDVLEKVTVIKDIDLQKPHRAHLEILHDLSLGALHERHRFHDFAGLHRAWAKTLDGSDLNQRFYLDVANWFFWASRHAKFPRPASVANAAAYQSLSLIRLVTRLVFCWFLKEKGLIPAELFQADRLRDILNDLDPAKATFYRAILQNLFFATLSVPMDERRFIGAAFQGKNQDYGKQHVYRFEDELRPEKMRELFAGVPFLNGGLFECLDVVPNKDEPDVEEVRIDGFSTRPDKQAALPNFLFFGPPRLEDLRKDYGDELRFSRVTVLPLLEIFERYKFTVAENTPVEEEVALDPELLGLVFENLLASFNDETKSTARKQTGAFYTPRFVVDHMVDAALTAHFTTALGDAPDVAARLKTLFAYTEEGNPFDPGETARLLDAIDSGDGTVKILDPACGSGAFPMGVLHRLVFLLRRLDPGNAAFRARQLARVRALDVGREAAERAVRAAFERDEDDYARKLYLIENCIYGVDINPIAVQIAKLRFFISLLVDQEISETRENRGVLPLPNLETKFVAANTLFALRRSGQTLLVSGAVRAKGAELLRVRHDHFNARHWRDKRALRRRDKELRGEIAGLLRGDLIVPGAEADQLAAWDPYAPNESASFFDPEWMFALDAARLSKPAGATLRGNFSLVNDAGGQTELIARGEPTESGFDIVIGNPPYVRQEQIQEFKPALKAQYHCFTGVADLYVYFYERSFDLLRVGGVLSFISSNKYLRAGYGQKLRHFLASRGAVQELIDFGDASVFTAIAYPSIILVRKTGETRDKGHLPEPPAKAEDWLKVAPNNSVRALKWEAKRNPESGELEPAITSFPDIFLRRSFTISQGNLAPSGWRLESATLSKLLDKVRAAGKPLSEIIQNRIFYGIKTGLNDAFVVDIETRDQLLFEHKSSAEVLVPFLRGRDLKRWRVNFDGQYLIKIESSENTRHPWSGKTGAEAEKIFAKTYPAIHARFHEVRGQLINRTDQGNYFWELRSCAYWKEFEKPKICYPDIYERQSFSWDEQKFRLANTCYFISTDEMWLTGLLNSLTVEWWYGKVSNRIRGGYLRAFTDYMRLIPVPPASDLDRKRIAERVREITQKKQDRDAFVGNLEAEIDGLVAHLYGLGEAEFKTILDELDLPDPARLAAAYAYRDAAKGLLK